MGRLLGEVEVHHDLTFSITLPETTDSAGRQLIAIEEDENLPIADVKTMEDLTSALIARSRTSTMIFGVFGALALLLSAIGIYGVMSYAVGQCTHEIDARMALDAQGSDVLELILREGCKITMIGLVIGSFAVFAVGRLLTKLLFGVGVAGPGTFIGVALLLAIVTLAACYLPARRATKVDPLIALRHE